MILRHLQKDISGRYPAIDIFRGVAIFTMLMANSAAESLAPPHHFYIRIYGSFAAPIFVCLAGFMVGISYEKHPLSYFILRGLEVVAVAALIDFFIWKIIPGTTFDVLYLTGLGIPVAAFTLKLKTPLRILLCILLFAAGPILQMIYSYEPSVHEFAKEGFSFSQFPHGIKWWLKSWLFDGWFPVFPWMGFILFGTLIYTHGSKIVTNIKLMLPLGIILFLGGLTWLFFHRPFVQIEEREGYSELFYPPGIPYLCAAIGAITIGLCALPYLKPKFGLQFLRFLGSCSLFIYILHSAVIAFVLDEYFTGLDTIHFLLMYSCFAAAMIICAWGLFELKKMEFWKSMPRIVKFIFGG